MTSPTLQTCYLSVRAKLPTMLPRKAREMATQQLRHDTAVFNNGGIAGNAEAWRHKVRHDMVPFSLASQMREQGKYTKGKGMFPRPVYVAHFADGTQRRFSFWSREGKPIDFAAGYNVALAIGRSAPVDGYIDDKGTAIRDPYFQPVQVAKPKKESAAARLAAICRALNEGEIDAALILAKTA